MNQPLTILAQSRERRQPVRRLPVCRLIAAFIMPIIFANTTLSAQPSAVQPSSTQSPPFESDSPGQLMTRSGQITFSTIFEEALNRSPETRMSDALQQQADSQRALGRRWINGAPALEAAVIDDRLLSDQGARELEAGVAVDLWRPGERRAAQTAGEAYHQRSTAWNHYLRWLTAGRVRDMLAALERADLQLAAARSTQEEARRLLETTRALQSAGAASQLEVLQAESQWLQHDRQILEAQAAAADAEQLYTVLTGLTVRPADPHRETVATIAGIPAEHPLLQLHGSEVTLGDSAIAEAEREARGSPSLSLGVRRERGEWSQPHIDSIGISVSLPLTSRTVVAAGTAQARTDRTDAELSRVLAMRELTTQLRETARALDTVRNTLPLVAREHELNQRQWEMAHTAFTAGEVDLTDVILALQRAQTSEYDLASLRLKQHHLVFEYNQILGVLP